MKMTKKFLIGAAVAAVAMVAGFTGCGQSLSGWNHQKFGNTDMLKYDDTTYASGKGTWTIEGDNTEGTDNNYRGIDCLMTKHNDMSAVVTLDELKSNGVIGVVADAYKVDSGVWSFLNIGISSTDKGSIQYYVSYFMNIDEKSINTTNMGATAYSSVPSLDAIKEVKEAGTYAAEIDCTKALKKSTFVTLSNEDGKVAVDAKQNDDGGYTISFYNAADVYKNGTFKVGDATALDTITVPGAYLGKEEDAQAWCGAYANVYKGCKLNGTLEIIGLTKEGEDF